MVAGRKEIRRAAAVEYERVSVLNRRGPESDCSNKQQDQFVRMAD